jgi:hypothetical protein
MAPEPGGLLRGDRGARRAARRDGADAGAGVTRAAILIAVTALAVGVAGCFGGDDKKSSSSRSPTATSDGSAATTTADTSVGNY